MTLPMISCPVSHPQSRKRSYSNHKEGGRRASTIAELNISSSSLTLWKHLIKIHFILKYADALQVHKECHLLMHIRIILQVTLYPIYTQFTPRVYIFKLISSGTREKATQVSRNAKQTATATVSCSKSCHQLPESGFSLNLLRGCQQ